MDLLIPIHLSNEAFVVTWNMQLWVFVLLILRFIYVWTSQKIFEIRCKDVYDFAVKFRCKFTYDPEVVRPSFVGVLMVAVNLKASGAHSAFPWCTLYVEVNRYEWEKDERAAKKFLTRWLKEQGYYPTHVWGTFDFDYTGEGKQENILISNESSTVFIEEENEEIRLFDNLATPGAIIYDGIVGEVIYRDDQTNQPRQFLTMDIPHETVIKITDVEWQIDRVVIYYETLGEYIGGHDRTTID